MAHEHNVKDSDTKYSINPITRDIKNESSSKTRLMQYDHNSERITFSLPLRVEEHEMSKCNVVQINYINICSTTKEEYRGLYDVTDLKIEGEEVTFSWLVSGNATRYAGSLNFIVTLKCVTDGVVEYRWSSAIYSGITIANGIDNTNEIAYEYADVLERWRDELVAGGAVDLGDYYTKAEVDDEINSLKEDIANGSGLNSSAKNLLINILRNGLYTVDQSENITKLENALASGSSGDNSGGDSGEDEPSTPTVTKYTITNLFTNVTSDNNTTSIEENTSYSATLTPNEGYMIDSILVFMGDEDITSTVVANGVITIPSVTANVEITAIAIEEQKEATLVEDGLVSYFDFRSATYNNEGSGGSTLIQPTQGNGQLYAWAKNMITEQNDYGMKSNRVLMYDVNGGTNQSECGETFTWVFKSYLTKVTSPMFSGDYASLNNMNKITYKPRYNTSSSTAQVTDEPLGSSLSNAYDLLFLVVDKNICKLYFGDTLVKEIDGSKIDGFVSWYSKLSVAMLGGSDNMYISQLAIYNRALSDVEITEMKAYLETLEVVA